MAAYKFFFYGCLQVVRTQKYQAFKLNACLRQLASVLDLTLLFFHLSLACIKSHDSESPGQEEAATTE